MSSARNSPCPCGSGCKRKHCCDARLRDEAALRCRDERVGRESEEWALTHLEAELEGAASALLEELQGRPHALWIAEHWLLLDHELPSGGTAAGRYAALAALSDADRQSAARIASSRMGLYRVLATLPGLGMDLGDLLEGGELTVRSPSVSAGASAGDVLLARVLPGPYPSLWGPARAYSGALAIALLEAVEPVVDDSENPLRDTWPFLMTLDATDGPSVAAHATWTIADAEAAFDRLPDAFEYVGHEDGAEVLAWCGGEDDIGFVELRDDRLVLCAFDAAGLDDGIEMIEDSLGTHARLVERHVDDLAERRDRQAHRRLAA